MNLSRLLKNACLTFFIHTVHAILIPPRLFPLKSKKKVSKTKMPSLVKKWQTIQKELDEEEKSSSSDEDRDLLNKKSIEEWKQQQLLT